MFFDLPTEAQWEYACRAGTSTALNNGKGYSVENLKEVARCQFNSGYSGSYASDKKGGYSYTTKVGCYRENAWGLYDMHGNVWELCRDFWNNTGLGFEGAIDPKGPTSSYYWRGDESYHVCKGGCWTSSSDCRVAYRQMYLDRPSTASDVGFRVMCSPVAE